MMDQVRTALEKIRPMPQADGGDIEWVEVKQGIVRIKLKGACSACPMSQMTLQNGLERVLRQAIPAIKAGAAMRRYFAGCSTGAWHAFKGV